MQTQKSDATGKANKSARPPAMLRIALVTETFPPEINGVAMTLEKLIQGLQRRGHTVQLVRPRQRVEAIIPDTDQQILVQGLPIPGYRGMQFGVPATSRLLNAWRRKTPDVVHIATEGPLGMSALKAAQKLGLPVTSSFHTNFHRYSRHYGFGWLHGMISGHLRKMHNRTAATFVPTQSLANELGADGYLNLRVMARGVDTQLFSPARRNDSLRASWGLAHDALAVLYVGRLAAEKNLATVVAAFKAIHVRRPDAKLIFVGDGPMAAKLKADCPNAVFCGSRTGEDLAAHFASGDLFLFPSLTETFGNVTTEALASGLGVVAYAHAAAADLIITNDNGVAVSVGDEAAYINAAVKLACNTEQLSVIRSRAAGSMHCMSWASVVETFASTLDSVCRNHPRRSHGTNDIVLAPD